MAEQTFKSPGFFEREIEVISRPLFRNTATPAAVIGTSLRGPAFVPTTVSSRDEFIRIFGNPDRNRLGGHAVNEFFNNGGKALTFCRVLGSGVAESANTLTKGGFSLSKSKVGSGDNANRRNGVMNILVASHKVAQAEHIGYGQLSDNDSISLSMDTSLAAVSDGSNMLTQLVRAMIITHKDYVVRIEDHDADAINADIGDDVAECSSSEFKIAFQHKDESENTGLVKVSLDPNSSDYIANVLNTNPHDLKDKKHLLYAHFPVDKAVADVAGNKVATLVGHDNTTAGSYGDFQSAYTTPKTTSFISQPFGNKEYDLFHFESLDDGAYANDMYKISISGLTASTDPKDEFGTFNVVVRDLKDTDEAPIVYETFNRCSLNPDSDNFIAKVIGDSRLKLKLDVVSDDEKRLLREGTFPNRSNKIRVVVSDDVLRREIPDIALPFGYRGLPALKTTSDGKDGTATNTSLLSGVGGGNDIAKDNDPQTASVDNVDTLGFSVLPPLPYRFKVTKGDIRQASDNSYGQTYLGKASDRESVNTALHWGILTTRVEDINKVNDAPSKLFNDIFTNYNKLLSNSSSVIISGTDADSFNNNKFSLAKIALSAGAIKSSDVAISDVTGTLDDVFKDAVYIRNADASGGLWDSSTNTIKMSESENDPFGSDASGEAKEYRASLAKLLAEDKKKFNKYNEVAKYTAPMYGGFDGVNITNRDDHYMTDRSCSIDTGGHAGDGGYETALAATTDGSMSGKELLNNVVTSYNNAIRVMTDGMIVNHNILVIPGIRDSLITDFASRRVALYGKALYVMDIPHYTSSGDRIFVSSTGLSSGRPDAEITSSQFDFRQLNNSYVSTYFPDVYVEDSGDDDDAAVASRRSVRVPSSIVALGALAKNDSILSPWFAPAGFNRGALNSIRATDVRLNAEDRDTLYEARINPIANFPNNQFVIFGQKTTQLAKTALDRVNVRRLVLEIKRRIETIAQGLLFEQNNQATRSRFISQSSAQLSAIQVGQGIEDFRVIMDDSNNSDEDVDNNRLNGQIIFVPTRAVEFIAIDFIITNSGVEYP